MTALIIFLSILGALLLHAAVFTLLAVRCGRKSLAEPDCDVVIILGSKVEGTEPCDDLLIRIECAAQYLSEHPGTAAIASGGCFREGQMISEAQCIADGLAARGIDLSRVMLEDEALTTYGNFQNSLKIISALPLNSPTVGILSNEYHLFRAGLIAKDSGLRETIKIGARSANPAAGYLRENVVIFEVYYRRLKALLQRHKV